LSYLLDTNILSEVRKGTRCNPGVAAWFAGVEPAEIFLSVVTLGEIRKGIEKIRSREQETADALEVWFQHLAAAYSNQLLPVDRAIAEQWGRFGVRHTLPVVDSLLAATARVHGLILVTRNVKDVERTGVDCLNPFRN
jgi:predicted nucleic acid-binding protein